MATKKDHKRAQRRILRVRSVVKKSGMPRVSVFRSNKHIYAQIIDDASHNTLVSLGSHQIDAQGDKSVVARVVGKQLAEKALKKGVSQVVFDRGPYKYHGRVKAFADGLREGGVAV